MRKRFAHSARKAVVLSHGLGPLQEPCSGVASPSVVDRCVAECAPLHSSDHYRQWKQALQPLGRTAHSASLLFASLCDR
jgi:hypothetical protein